MSDDDVLQHATSEAVRAFRDVVEEAGGTVVKVLVLAHCSDVTPTGIVAGEGKGMDDAERVLSFILTSARGVAHASDIGLAIVPGDEARLRRRPPRRPRRW